MPNFTISTDSCVDQFSSYLQQNKIFYIILKRITDGVVTEEVYDSEDEYKEFYKQLKSGALPTTSQLNEFELKEYFLNISKKCEGDIIHLSLSSGLSGTYQCASQAAEEVSKQIAPRRVIAVDSLSASRLMALLVDKLLEMQKQNLPTDDAVKKLEHIRDHLQGWAIVSDLKHLKRGGRLSGFKSTVGSLLNVKPVLAINSEGKLQIAKTLRGEKRSIDFVMEMMEKHGKKANDEFLESTIYIMHSGENKLLSEIEAAIKNNYGDIKVNKAWIGPIVGTHVGNDAVAVIFEGAKRSML